MEEDILEQNPLLPESMTDALRGLHGSLERKQGEENHSCLFLLAKCAGIHGKELPVHDGSLSQL